MSDPNKLIEDMRVELAAIRDRTIEECARVADGYALDAGLSKEFAREIAAEIRALAKPPRRPLASDAADFPSWAFT